MQLPPLVTSTTTTTTVKPSTTTVREHVTDSETRIFLHDGPKPGSKVWLDIKLGVPVFVYQDELGEDWVEPSSSDDFNEAIAKTRGKAKAELIMLAHKQGIIVHQPDLPSLQSMFGRRK